MIISVRNGSAQSSLNHQVSACLSINSHGDSDMESLAGVNADSPAEI